MDPRIRMMIENGVKSKQRTMFVIVGDKGRDQVIFSLAAAVELLRMKKIFAVEPAFRLFCRCANFIG